MDPQKPKTSAKDFFLNLGAIVALYTTIIALLNLLFTVINSAYPQITQYYSVGSSSISMPVATLIIFFPIYILLMWLLEKSYVAEPDKKHLGVRRWLTYITLFIAGLTLAGDLVTVLYHFIDGQELTTGFLLKVLSVLVIILAVFLYYISDIREKLTSRSRKVWTIVSIVIILASIVWGFAVLGSPRTQQLYKYDEQKVSDLQTISGYVRTYYATLGYLPESLQNFNDPNAYEMHFTIPTDIQTGKSYVYEATTNTDNSNATSGTFKVCATFNKATNTSDTRYQIQPTPIYMESGVGVGGGVGVLDWTHPAGYYCFNQTVTKTPVAYPQTYPAPAVK